jgi:pectinesterase
VLATPVERRRFNAEGHAYASHGEYPQAMRDLATARRVPLVDLTALSMSLWDSLGAEATKDYFLWLDAGEAPGFPDGVQDNTHFQAHGAIELARIVVKELVRLHVLHRGSTHSLAKPVPDDALTWPAEVYTP